MRRHLSSPRVQSPTAGQNALEALRYLVTAFDDEASDSEIEEVADRFNLHDMGLTMPRLRRVVMDHAKAILVEDKQP